MARFLRKDEKGNDVLGYDFETELEVKAVGDNEIEIVGSTATRDRDDEVIVADGIDLRNYKKNPVVLPAHDYWQPAIGRAKSVKLENGKLKFRIEFPEEGVNPVADIYRKLYKSGFMKASSIGFIPKEWNLGKGDKDPRRTFTKTELLEISLVSVPANPQALVTEKSIQEAMSKGILSYAEVEKASQYKPMRQDDEKVTKDWTGEIKTLDELVEKVRDKINGDIKTTIKSIILDLKKKGELDKSVDHYSKVLFGGSERKTPKNTPGGEDSAKVVDAVKDVLTKEL
jgi:HK97 family phage prohead protease